MDWLKPETEQIRFALRQYAASLADEPIEFFAEGWEFWAFTAGDYVLRFPKSELSIRSLRLDRDLIPALALSTPVPQIEIWGDEGPNRAPFAGHVRLPGRPVWPDGKPGLGFGRQLGLLMRQLHTFPVDRAISLGVRLVDGPALRAERGQDYERVIRRVFPLVSCEARTRIEQVYETYLNDDACFDFEPRLTHQDLDGNTLIDETTGEITGIIDFGSAVVSSLAIDYWLPLFGFDRLGIGDQTNDCLTATGIGAESLAKMRPEVEFIEFRYPLMDIEHGLDTGEDGFVEGGIRALNASLPGDLVCE